MNIRTTTPEHLFHNFLLPTLEILDILTKGALTFVHAAKRRRRGKRSGALVRLRQRDYAQRNIPLQRVLTAQQSGRNATAAGQKQGLSSSEGLCFTETWLYGLIPDSVLQLAGFQLYRTDRDTALSGKTQGGGICFYVNGGWCNDETVIQQYCSSDL